MSQKPLSPSLYDEEFFLTNNSGWLEWAKGQRDAGRFGFMFKQAQIKPGDRILDLGCGRGELGYLCAKAGATVTLIDYSPDAIKLAKQTMVDFPKAKLICGDAKEFPITKYDHIFALDMLEHLWDWEIGEILKRARQCGAILWVYTSPEKNWALKKIPGTMGDRLRHINCQTKESLELLFGGWEVEFIPYLEMSLVLKARIKPLVFSLSLDDFSPAVDFYLASAWLFRLLKEYPKLKVNLFTIPYFKDKKIIDCPEWIRFVKNLPKENFDICLHGYTHKALDKYVVQSRNNNAEFELLTKEEALESLTLAETLLNEAGIKFSKVFKPPCWYLGKEARKALIEKGYRIVSLTGMQEEGDLVSGRWRPYCFYSVHVSNHDGNTTFLNEHAYQKIKEILKNDRNIDYKFISELP